MPIKFNRKKESRFHAPEEIDEKLLGPNLNFAAAEAYKRLRTNLEFSIPGGESCRVIGVTSSLMGEGKSTTTINMAYTIAQTGKRVLLLEADLRMPTMARRLDLKEQPGLSNLLVGLSSVEEALQQSELLGDVSVITAGELPPNPAELLASRAMEKTMEKLNGAFDVILVDLPPVNVVSDALIISRMLSGVVVVVRQDYCDRQSLGELMRQMQYTGAKLLGFVVTGSHSDRRGSYRKGYGSDSYAGERL